MKELEEIYNNINNGKVYGKNYTWGYSINLWLSDKGNIGWQNYGQSWNKNTLKELKWVIEEIFNMTPKEFTQKYVLKELR